MRETDAAGWKAGKKRRCDIGVKKTKRILWVCIFVLAGIIDLTVLIVNLYYARQENIFFTEYDGTYDKECTTIYQYNSRINATVEIGKVQGNLNDCVINDEETFITGISKSDDEGFEILRYDLATKSVETLDAAKEIAALIDNTAMASKILLYSGGDKVFVSYIDNRDGIKWLFYDLNSGRYDICKGESGRCWTIHNGSLWYISNGAICQYDMESKEKTPIAKAVFSDYVVMPETGLVAYTMGNSIKKIYLYDIRTQKSNCIARGGWNTYYGVLLWTNSRWSDNGREFFYVKSFPGFFNASIERLMVYDVLTCRSRCIYRSNMTTNYFQYVMKR